MKFKKIVLNNFRQYKGINEIVFSTDDAKNVTVVYSNEKPINNTMLGSTAFVPAVAGLYITNYIINDIIKSTK